MIEKALRFGGREAGGRFLFELTGGAPSLDFVNTLDERRATPIERLNTYGDLIDWSMQAGVLSSSEGQALLVLAQQEPAQAAEVLKVAIEVRELFFEVIQTLVASERLSDAALAKLNVWISKASRRRRIVRSGAGLTWSSGDASVEFDVLLWRLIESAALNFASDDLRGRFRICGGCTCAWVFLDFSRQKNRRWCDMSVCGNRAKARRHYHRSRAVVAGKDGHDRSNTIRPGPRRTGVRVHHKPNDGEQA